MTFGATRAARALVAAVVLTAAATGGALGFGATAGAVPPSPTYYVALGDSLGAGVGASPASNAYVNLIYQHELARIPSLQLQNFSCSGATTSSMLVGPSCAATTQLAQAKAFLKAHHGHVAFVTIDIGANDVDGCTSGGGLDATCLLNGLGAVSHNLPLILSGLKSAYPGINVIGMNYYDPFLVSWLSGPSGQVLAQQTVGDSDLFNSILANIYTAAGFPTADVATQFQTDDFSLTGSYNSVTEPQNVANVCNWTHMCDALDFHANNDGHAVLAQSFEPLIDAPIAPDAAPGVVSAVAGNGRAALTWSPPATSDAGFTGYVVTPYLGGVAQAPRLYTSTATARTVTGLVNGQFYTFTVAAENNIGTGPQSAPSAAVIVGAPDAPTKVRVVSGATALATGTLTVAFGGAYAGVANHGSPITQFNTTCTSNDGGATQSAVHIGATVTPLVVAGVTTGASYSCTVTATNARGTGPASLASSTVIVGAPLAPAKPAVANIAPGSLKVTVKAPANNGAPITTETATCVSTNGGATASTAAAASPFIVAGLTVGKSYSCSVVATNSRGNSPPSTASRAITA